MIIFPRVIKFTFGTFQLHKLHKYVNSKSCNALKGLTPTCNYVHFFKLHNFFLNIIISFENLLNFRSLLCYHWTILILILILISPSQGITLNTMKRIHTIEYKYIYIVNNKRWQLLFPYILSNIFLIKLAGIKFIANSRLPTFLNCFFDDIWHTHMWRHLTISNVVPVWRYNLASDIFLHWTDNNISFMYACSSFGLKGIGSMPHRIEPSLYAFVNVVFDQNNIEKLLSNLWMSWRRGHPQTPDAGKGREGGGQGAWYWWGNENNVIFFVKNQDKCTVSKYMFSNV